MHRSSERLANKQKKNEGYYSFVPELDFRLANPMAHTNKLDNELHAFRETLKQPNVSDFVSAMDKEISAHEMHERWKIVPRMSTGGKRALKSAWAFKRKRDLIAH